MPIGSDLTDELVADVLERTACCDCGGGGDSVAAAALLPETATTTGERSIDAALEEVRSGFAG
jgi:hypothetical protein